MSRYSSLFAREVDMTGYQKRPLDLSPNETPRFSWFGEDPKYRADPSCEPSSLFWTNWHRSLYLSPGGIMPTLPMPPLYGLPSGLPDVVAEDARQSGVDDSIDKKTSNSRSNCTERKCSENENPTYPQQYQVKWSNHTTRLTAFISSLQGDVDSSDTIITAKDGALYHAHRLVLASASPFFRRTLKKIPKEQQAVIVIPAASSHLVPAILTFCYTGVAQFPKAHLQAVLQLAEDLEITGFLSVKEEQHSQKESSPLSTSTFVPSSGGSSLEDTITTSPYAPPTFSSISPPNSAPPSSKRPTDLPINYSQHHKRIKSESDADMRDSMRRNEELSEDYSEAMSKRDTSLFQPVGPLSYYPNQSELHFGKLIPRQASSTGSRVLLWRFLLELLHDRRYAPYYIRWLDRRQGIFRIMESDKVAQLWGVARKNENMTYEKMSRGMRTYYKRGILFHLDGTKLIYRFNMQEPEIQHQLRYHDLVYRAYEEPRAANEPPRLLEEETSLGDASSPLKSTKHISFLTLDGASAEKPLQPPILFPRPSSSGIG